MSPFGKLSFLAKLLSDCEYTPKTAFQFYPENVVKYCGQIQYTQTGNGSWLFIISCCFFLQLSIISDSLLSMIQRWVGRERPRDFNPREPKPRVCGTHGMVRILLRCVTLHAFTKSQWIFNVPLLWAVTDLVYLGIMLGVKKVGFVCRAYTGVSAVCTIIAEKPVASNKPVGCAVNGKWQDTEHRIPWWTPALSATLIYSTLVGWA